LTFTTLNGEAFQATLTPRNVTEVEDLVKQVLEGETLNPAIALQIKKLHKVAIKAIANTTIQSSTNEELLMQLKKRKKREARTNEQLAGYGRYLGLEILEERATKHLQMVWKDLLRLDPRLFSEIKKPVAIKLSGRGNQRAFTAAVKPFLQLDPAIFTTVILTTWTLESTNSSIQKSQHSRPFQRSQSQRSQPSQPSQPSQATRSGRAIKKRVFLGDESMNKSL